MFTYTKEKQLHRFIVNNFSRYFDFEYRSSELVIDGGRIDIIGMDNDTIYVIEIKRDFITNSTLQQLMSYIPTMNTLYPDKNIKGIAVAPKIDAKVNVAELPADVSIKTIDDVIFKKPVSKSTKKAITFTLNQERIQLLRDTSDKTMIPQARIVEQAILEYIEKMKSSK